MSKKEKWQPQNSKPGKAFVHDPTISPDPKLFKDQFVGRIVFIFVILDELIIKVMIDKDGGKVGIITLPVAVYNPFPVVGRMFEKDKDEDVTGKDKFGGIFVKVFHDLYTACFL